MMKKTTVWGGLILLLLMLSMPAWAGNGAGSGGSGYSTDSSTTATTTSDSEDEDSDRPDYAGIPGNETKPGSGNEEPGVAMGDLYGDLYIIVRDENGAPILYEWVWEDGMPVEAFESANGFVQPIAIAGTLTEFDGLVPLDIEGEVPEAYAAYVQEVEFGRLNVVRAPQAFLDRAYAEAINNINSADEVTIDPAGRLLLLRYDETTLEWSEKAVDAPRENLALYQKLMTYGYLPDLNRSEAVLAHLHPVDPTVAETLTASDLDQAAAFLAAAADKTGSINVDMVIYLNAILGLNGDTGTTYFDFTSYQYQRGSRHGKPEAEVLIGPYYGYGNNPNVAWFKVGTVNIMHVVFDDDDTVTATKARGFAKAGDDALKVISYIHNWAVPEYDE